MIGWAAVAVHMASTRTLLCGHVESGGETSEEIMHSTQAEQEDCVHIQE